MYILLNILLLLSLLLCSKLCLTLKILQMGQGFNPSHVIFNHKLAKSLTNGGHNITLVMVEHFLDLSGIKPLPGIREYRIGSTLDAETRKVAETAYNDIAFKPHSIIGFSAAVLYTVYSATSSCKLQLNQERGIISKLASEKFDLLFTNFFDICPYFFAHSLGIEKIAVHSAMGGVVFHVAESMQIPIVPSYIPDPNFSYSTDTMDFMDRVQSVIWNILTFIFLKFQIYSEDVLYEKPGRPSAMDLRKKAQALFINGESYLEFPRPFPYGVNYLSNLVGSQPPAGIQAETHKELDNYWKQIVESGKSGTILFSLGTVANTSNMPQEMIDGMLGAFAQFPDYSVIWRMEKPVPSASQYNHIHLVPWLPQPQILAHSKTKLFITHCGYNSLVEAAQAGTPVLAVPLYADQIVNSLKAVKLNIGLSVDKMTMKDSKSMAKVIRSVLESPRISASAKKLQEMAKESIASPDVLFNHRISYLHKAQWFPSLSAAQKLNIIQYHCIDIIVLVGGIIFTILFIVFHIAKLIVCLIFYKLK